MHRLWAIVSDFPMSTARWASLLFPAVFLAMLEGLSASAGFWSIGRHFGTSCLPRGVKSACACDPTKDALRVKGRRVNSDESPRNCLSTEAALPPCVWSAVSVEMPSSYMLSERRRRVAVNAMFVEMLELLDRARIPEYRLPEAIVLEQMRDYFRDRLRRALAVRSHAIAGNGRHGNCGKDLNQGNTR
jgi:hypothetical protein